MIIRTYRQCLKVFTAKLVYIATDNNKIKIAEYVALFPNVMFGIHKDHYYAYWLEPINHAYTLEHMDIYYVGEDTAFSDEYKSLREQNY